MSNEPRMCGDMAKLREALEDDGTGRPLICVVEDALSAPPRNCDVGTVKDQTQRFYRFCKSRSGAAIGGECDPNCPCYDCDDVCQCLLAWSQMPYKVHV